MMESQRQTKVVPRTGPRSKDRRGFTLLEVMIVLLLMSMLMGIGVGAFSKVGGGPELARSQIREVIRTTRRHALREKAPAVVFLEPAERVVSGVGWRSVGTWHFESSVDGLSRGFPTDAGVESHQIAPQGVIGSCLDLTDASSPGVMIPTISSLNAVPGVSLELYVLSQVPATGPGSGTGQRRLIGKGDFYSLSIDEDGRLVGGLRLAPAGVRSSTAVDRFQIVSDDYYVPQGKWTRVAMHFNGYTCVLSADGIVLEEEEFPRRMRILTDQTTPIMIGNRSEPFFGFIDEVRIGIAVSGEEMILPETVELGGKAQRIHFDRYGRLDSNHHTKPVEIRLTTVSVQPDESGSRARTLTVGLFGEVW